MTRSKIFLSLKDTIPSTNAGSLRPWESVGFVDPIILGASMLGATLHHVCAIAYARTACRKHGKDAIELCGTSGAGVNARSDVVLWREKEGPWNTLRLDGKGLVCECPQFRRTGMLCWHAVYVVEHMLDEHWSQSGTAPMEESTEEAHEEAMEETMKEAEGESGGSTVAMRINVASSSLVCDILKMYFSTHRRRTNFAALLRSDSDADVAGNLQDETAHHYYRMLEPVLRTGLGGTGRVRLPSTVASWEVAAAVADVKQTAKTAARTVSTATTAESNVDEFRALALESRLRYGGEVCSETVIMEGIRGGLVWTFMDQLRRNEKIVNHKLSSYIRNHLFLLELDAKAYARKLEGSGKAVRVAEMLGEGTGRRKIKGKSRKRGKGKSKGKSRNETRDAAMKAAKAAARKRVRTTATRNPTGKTKKAAAKTKAKAKRKKRKEREKEKEKEKKRTGEDIIGALVQGEEREPARVAQQAADHFTPRLGQAANRKRKRRGRNANLPMSVFETRQQERAKAKAKEVKAKAKAKAKAAAAAEASETRKVPSVMGNESASYGPWARGTRRGTRRGTGRKRKRRHNHGHDGDVGDEQAAEPAGNEGEDDGAEFDQVSTAPVKKHKPLPRHN